MATQIEAKIKELKTLKRKEYYKQKDTDLKNWGIAKNGKGKKATPVVISDDEYENLIKLSSGLGKTGRNPVAITLRKASVTTAVLCAVIALFSLFSGANSNFVAFSAAGFGFSLVFRGLSEAIRLLQQILDGGKGVIPEEEPEEPEFQAPAAPFAAPNGFAPVQPPVYQAPVQPPVFQAPAYQPSYPQQPYFAPNTAPVAPPIVNAAAPAPAPEKPKTSDYHTMPTFVFNAKTDLFPEGYEPKSTFGDNL